jgi:hypothetical protein
VINVRERGVPLKVRCLYCLMEVYIYMGQSNRNPRLSRMCKRSDRQGGGQTVKGSALGETLIAYRCHHEGPLMGRAKPHAGGGSGPMYL